MILKTKALERPLVSCWVDSYRQRVQPFCECPLARKPEQPAKGWVHLRRCSWDSSPNDNFFYDPHAMTTFPWSLLRRPLQAEARPGIIECQRFVDSLLQVLKYLWPLAIGESLISQRTTAGRHLALLDLPYFRRLHLPALRRRFAVDSAL